MLGVTCTREILTVCWSHPFTQNVHRITVVPFDGQNWEANGAALADKSKET